MLKLKPLTLGSATTYRKQKRYRDPLQTSGQVFRYAEVTGRVDRDISQALKGALSKVDKGHFSSLTEPLKASLLLRAIDVYSGTFVVKSALQLAPLVFVRPSELRQAEWEHIDLEAKEWRYLVTKTKTSHICPLIQPSR